MQTFATTGLFTGAGMDGVGVDVNVGVMVGVLVALGVGVAGMGYSGRLAVLPTTVAYSPQSQQLPEPLGRLMIQ